MARNPVAAFPTRTTPADANYPWGSSKDESAPGAFDGTPYESGRANDVFGMQQALLHQLGLVPSGNADTAIASQYLEGIQRLISRGVVFVDSGAANAYVVAPIAPLQAQSAYFNGQQITFKATNTNTGASTLNVSALGVKSITNGDGTALTAGQISANQYITVIYNLDDDRFELPGTQPGTNEAVFSLLGDGTILADIFGNVTIDSVTKDIGANTFTIRATISGFSAITLANTVCITSSPLPALSDGNITIVDADTIDIVYGYDDNAYDGVDFGLYQFRVSLRQ